jgi:hypothetical protein
MYADVNMRVPDYRLNPKRGGSGRSPWRRAAVLAALLILPAAHAVRGPQPVLRLPLSGLGFQGISQSFQDAGASFLTVHFIDNTHLLVTFSLRGLVERIKDDPPGDDDRAVAAVLVELPSGRVLARARWHLHDHGQYLWSLGGGRFLLRTRSTLTSISPLINLASGDAFRQSPFAALPGIIDALVVSPEGDLVTVETSPPRKPPVETNVVLINAAKEPPPVETFFFIRTSGSGSAESPLLAVSAGSVRAQGVGVLPLNGRGYLFAKAEKRSRWAMEFNGFDGESRKLSTVDSSCPPRLEFVSPSQFVVFSCRGSDDKVMLSSFNFLPMETWEEPFGGPLPPLQFAYAPQSGRFALSRVVLSTPSTAPGTTSVGAGDPNTQEVRVYQVESGDLLVKLYAAPVSRTGQNFDLSADGLNALVVHDGAIELYRLPPPSEQDKKDLAEVQQKEPPLPHSNLVRLKHLAEEAADSGTEASPAQSVAAKPAPVSAPAASASSPANAPANAGDVDTHRAPPSLLNPGETVDNGKKPPQ